MDEQKGRLRDRLLSKIQVVDGHWIWTKCTNRPGGYGLIKVDGIMELAHRVSWRVFRGPIPDGIKVLHECDLPLCINPDCLFLGTLSDNTQDMLSKGRNTPTRGEANARSKLTNDQVIRLRELSTSRSAIELAEAFSISKRQVGRIVHNEHWVGV